MMKKGKANQLLLPLWQQGVDGGGHGEYFERVAQVMAQAAHEDRGPEKGGKDASSRSHGVLFFDADGGLCQDRWHAACAGHP